MKTPKVEANPLDKQDSSSQEIEVLRLRRENVELTEAIHKWKDLAEARQVIIDKVIIATQQPNG